MAAEEAIGRVAETGAAARDFGERRGVTELKSWLRDMVMNGRNCKYVRHHGDDRACDVPAAAGNGCKRRKVIGMPIPDLQWSFWTVRQPSPIGFLENACRGAGLAEVT